MGEGAAVNTCTFPSGPKHTLLPGDWLYQRCDRLYQHEVSSPPPSPFDAGAQVRLSRRGSALMRAAFRGWTEGVLVLLRCKPLLEARDTHGFTALRYALEADEPNPDTVAALLKAGADVNARCCDGRTPMHALAEALPAAAARLVRVLVDAGGTIDARSHVGETPLMLAVKNADMVAALIAAGADVNACSDAHYTVLQQACRVQPVQQVVVQLLRAGAKPDVRHPDTHETALMMSVHHPSIVWVLLEGGADPFVVNGAGKTALDLAGAVKQYELVVPMLSREMKRRKARVRGVPNGVRGHGH